MKVTRLFFPCFSFVVLFLMLAFPAIGQDASNLAARTIYNDVKAFSLTGGKADVNNLVLVRDRVTMTLTGTIYFAAPVAGKVTGAVFVGTGMLHADTPPSQFEKDNVKRLLKADAVESDFKTAIFRFTDDTYEIIGKNRVDGSAGPELAKMVAESDARTMEETGANIASRVTLSLANRESPGFFFATFDGGKRNRFNYLLDSQNRIPTMYFDVNGGEAGLIYTYNRTLKFTEIWLAFYPAESYKSGFVAYSDLNDIVDIASYKMDVDLRSPKQKLGVRSKVLMESRFDGVSAIPFTIGQGLGEDEDERLKKQMRLKSVRFGEENATFVQEDWEAAATVFLPRSVKKGEKFELEFEFEGDFIHQPEIGPDTHYPRSTTSWYPQHGYLDRSTYEITFLHSKRLKISTSGTRVSEEVSPENKDLTVTKYRMIHPVALMTFALAPYVRHNETIKWDNGDPPIQLEYNSLSGVDIKEDFIMAELNNSVRYFHSIFGKYPYESYGAAFHPYGFGQGFPSMIMIPPTDSASKYTYAFIAHETAHQWWGNIVAWRSYRDQWLSEGFAEYSGVLYASLRKDRGAAINLINEMRRSLREPPETTTGYGKGQLATVGPLILGHRLGTSKSTDAYGTLIYNKGALVLRMLHFLFTDPQTGKGDAFFTMMKDFVEKHRDGVASTEDFMAIANKHFPATAIAAKYKLKDLNWFFREYVYESDYPSYRMTYELLDQPDGTCVMSITILQENASEKFATVLPVNISFGGDSRAIATVAAVGPKTVNSIKLPRRPQKAELDPEHWILSEKTETK